MGSPSSKLPRFVLFGDSLTEWSFDEHTEGFGWALQQIYEGKVDVVNEGFAGYTSRAVQPEFSRIIASASRQDAAPVLLFTIFLGANDACYVGDGEYVPLASFEANLRRFVDDILAHDGLHAAKIVLITPPPINIPDPAPESDDGDDDDDDDAQLTPAAREALASARQDPKKERGYRTYMNKKRYADRVMDMGAEYKQTGRVVGLNYWKALVDAALDDQKRLGDEHQYDEERLPGCGLRGAKAFKRGYFTDGLHLDKLGYNVLSKALLDIVCQTWPELRPERIGT